MNECLCGTTHSGVSNDRVETLCLPRWFLSTPPIHTTDDDICPLLYERPKPRASQQSIMVDMITSLVVESPLTAPIGSSTKQCSRTVSFEKSDWVNLMSRAATLAHERGAQRDPCGKYNTRGNLSEQLVSKLTPFRTKQVKRQRRNSPEAGSEPGPVYIAGKTEQSSRQDRVSTS